MSQRATSLPPAGTSRRLATLVLAAAVVAHVALPGPARAQAGATALIGPDELEARLRASDPVLINVHVPYEGEIEGTDALIPYDRIGDDPSLLPADKDAEVVLYCLSGRMSAIAAERLAEMGYTRVSDLDGGMNAWSASGRQLVSR